MVLMLYTEVVFNMLTCPFRASVVERESWLPVMHQREWLLDTGRAAGWLLRPISKLCM